MPIWRMAIDRQYSSYAEIKERHVIATGWSTLGDLSCLYQLCRLGFLDWPQAYNILTIWALQEGHNSSETVFKNSFKRLLFEIKLGDIVIGYEGTTARGICQICNCFTYGYDYDGLISCVYPSAFHKPPPLKLPKFEYAHCLYGVEWVDWDTFNRFVTAAGDDPILPAGGAYGPIGIDNRDDSAARIQLHWDTYVAANPGIVPCSAAIRIRCEKIKAQAPTDCCTQLAYWRSIFMHTEIEKSLELKKQVIFYGPPGTGKTHYAKEFVEQHWKLPLDRYKIVQFHPAYNYEDFVRGIQVRTVGSVVEYHTVHRIFSEMCKAAKGDPEKNYVLIIDEINRANLASVLGELIYGLEYRGDVIRTPYEVDGTFDLIVPKNLYIIGTMNTADRSIGHIDYAVRRRFAFMPMRPDRRIIEQVVTLGKLRLSALQLFDAVASLFKEGEKGALTGDFFADDVQPGHTYFLAKSCEDLAKSCEDLLGNFIYQVLPLLHEYVKDGVLKPEATLEIGGFKQKLGTPIDPVKAFEEIRKLLPCFDAADKSEKDSELDNKKEPDNTTGAA